MPEEKSTSIIVPVSLRDTLKSKAAILGYKSIKAYLAHLVEINPEPKKEGGEK